MSAPDLSTRPRVGLVLAGVLSLANVPSALVPTPDGDVGPPVGILVLGSALGVVGIVAVVLAWRGSGAATRVVAGCLIVSALSGLPAFFVDVPMAIKALVAVSVILTVAAVVLIFSVDRRLVPVVD